MKRFALEVYEPGTNLDASFSFESDEAWPAIAVGDLINPSMFPSHLDKRMRRAVSVEHMIWESPDGPFKHKVMVFTEAIEEADLVAGQSTRAS